MHIFLDELQKRHRANLARLYARHKAGIGYVFLLVGVIVALVLGFKGQDEARSRESANIHHALVAQQHRERESHAITCENITRADRQTLINLNTKVDKELIKTLHIMPKVLKDSIHKQLTLSAEQRKSLQPSEPATACSSATTTLVKGKPPTLRENILGKHFVPEVAPAPKATKLPGRTTTTAPHVAPVPVHRAPTHHAAPRLKPAPRSVPRGTPPKAQGSPGVIAPPVAQVPKAPPLVTPIPTPTPQPPLVKVPPVTVGPVTTPEVKVP